MKLYNHLTKKVEEFKPKDPENVKVYTCGPTVYSYAHIGNFTSYIYWDLLVRTLISNGYKVNRILNFTDVGHLTSDADEGEDKLEKGAKREGKSVFEIADFYINAFLKDFRSLNLIEPKKFARATDYIKEDEELVDLLTKKGFTYETSDGIYFDTSKFEKYADFANLDLENLKGGARVALSSEKRSISDFAVWKYIKEGENHAMRWNYNNRPGYPGWHLECAAISHTELGFPLDIHTGGIDHIPVHHTNEIAEAEAAYGVEMSRLWTHCNFITIDNEKISKSLGNTYTLAELKERGFSPLDFKLWVLQGHYQGTRNFNFEDLAAAKSRRLKWRNEIAKLYQLENKEENPAFRAEILEAVNDNLNSAKAFAIIDSARSISLSDWKYLDKLFGLNLISSSPDISKEVESEIKARETARLEKDFETADKIRLNLEEKQNITILDTKTGPIWQYLS